MSLSRMSLWVYILILNLCVSVMRSWLRLEDCTNMYCTRRSSMRMHIFGQPHLAIYSRKATSNINVFVKQTKIGRVFSNRPLFMLYSCDDSEFHWDEFDDCTSEEEQTSVSNEFYQLLLAQTEAAVRSTGALRGQIFIDSNLFTLDDSEGLGVEEEDGFNLGLICQYIDPIYTWHSAAAETANTALVDEDDHGVGYEEKLRIGQFVENVRMDLDESRMEMDATTKRNRQSPMGYSSIFQEEFLLALVHDYQVLGVLRLSCAASSSCSAVTPEDDDEEEEEEEEKETSTAQETRRTAGDNSDRRCDGGSDIGDGSGSACSIWEMHEDKKELAQAMATSMTYAILLESQRLEREAQVAYLQEEVEAAFVEIQKLQVHRERTTTAKLNGVRSGVQTIRTMAKLLKQRLHQEDEIGLELADNVITQIDAFQREVGEESDIIGNMNDDDYQVMDSILLDDDSRSTEGGGGGGGVYVGDVGTPSLSIQSVLSPANPSDPDETPSMAVFGSLSSTLQPAVSLSDHEQIISSDKLLVGENEKEGEGWIIATAATAATAPRIFDELDQDDSWTLSIGGHTPGTTTTSSSVLGSASKAMIRDNTTASDLVDEAPQEEDMLTSTTTTATSNHGDIMSPMTLLTMDDNNAYGATTNGYRYSSSNGTNGVQNIKDNQDSTTAIRSISSTSTGIARYTSSGHNQQEELYNLNIVAHGIDFHPYGSKGDSSKPHLPRPIPSEFWTAGKEESNIEYAEVDETTERE